MHEISKGKCDSFIQAYKHHKCTRGGGGGGGTGNSFKFSSMIIV